MVVTAEVMKELGERIAANPMIVKKIKAVFVWNVTGGGTYIMDLKNGPGSVKEGKPEGKVDCEITVAEEDFVAMMQNKTNSQKLFMQGKLKVKGGMNHAMKLGQLMQAQAKL
mmetsp:Transcript_8466/g.21105  ORF Transcript_8466/g.21105 Transcript_8466/m.21105 type:complete len:112 (-) Transcript_8466:170-505(-)